MKRALWGRGVFTGAVSIAAIACCSAALSASCGGSGDESGAAAGDPASSASSAGEGGSGGAGGGGGGVGGAGGGAAALPSTAPRGAEATAALCSNGIDDDGNGYADCDDTWCRQTVEIAVCDSLENTAAKCGDGIDNLESPRFAGQSSVDGRIDCADPDCSKNLALDVCPPHAFELGDAACSNKMDDDGDGLVDCEDLDCLHAGASACALGGKKRVLFDDAHRQRAGNADWVIDMPGRHPWPTIPAGELEWAGLLSSFGKDLVGGGYVVEILPAATGRFSHKSASNEQDLSHYDVVVVPEPSAPFDADESAALLAYVQAGGGLLMVTDHFQSDRDGNGWDSVQVWNAFSLSAGGDLSKSPFGFSVKELSYDDSGLVEAQNKGSTAVIADAAHPVIAGGHGTVTRLGMHKGGIFTLQPGGGAAVTVLVHALPLGTAGYEAGSPYVVAAEVGAGRVVAIGDSAITGDGTNSHGVTTPGFDSYHEVGEENGTLLLNAIDWLSGGAPMP